MRIILSPKNTIQKIMAFDFVDDDDNSIRFADKTGTKKFSEHFPKKADIKGMKTKNKRK
jgi:hypothetical protein